MTRQTFRKVTTSPELWEKVNPENKKLMAKFLKEKNVRSSDLTVKNYESDLQIYFTYVLLNNDNKHFTEIKKLELAEFFSYAIEELHWGSSRFSRVKSCLSSFGNFIEKYFDDQFPLYRSLALKAVDSMPKEAVREKTILSEKQVDDVLKYFYEQEEYQLCCWFALTAASGSRFAETFRFTVDNIDLNNTAFEGIFIETLKPIKTKGRTKTGKMLKKYIIKDIFEPYYVKWLEVRNKKMIELGKNHNMIFIGDSGEPAQEGMVRGWVSKIEKFLKVPFYPHSLRHYFTTYLVKAKLPNELIQEIVGWSSEGMIKIYSDMRISDRKFDELDNLKQSLKTTQSNNE